MLCVCVRVCGAECLHLEMTLLQWHSKPEPCKWPVARATPLWLVAQKLPSPRRSSYTVHSATCSKRTASPTLQLDLLEQHQSVMTNSDLSGRKLKLRFASSMRSLQSAVVPRAAVETGCSDRGESTLNLIRCPLPSYTSRPGWQTMSSLEGEPTLASVSLPMKAAIVHQLHGVICMLTQPHQNLAEFWHHGTVENLDQVSPCTRCRAVTYSAAHAESLAKLQLCAWRLMNTPCGMPSRR